MILIEPTGSRIINDRRKIYAAVFFCLFALRAWAVGLPKAADGFEWKDFPKQCVVLQVPIGWQWKENDNHPAQTIKISPKFEKNGGYDSGFTLNAVVCRSEKEWRDAYYSALKVWSDRTQEIKALGEPTFEKKIQTKEMMQVLVIEGDLYLPNAPHPKKKYRVRTYVRAIPKAGMIYVYEIGALVDDWDKIWKVGSTMMEPIIFHLPDEEVPPP